VRPGKAALFFLLVELVELVKLVELDKLVELVRHGGSSLRLKWLYSYRTTPNFSSLHTLVHLRHLIQVELVELVELVKSAFAKASADKVG